ncbi:hypothetical protein V8E53_000181 [Lactarius tabidus]
MRKRLTLAFVLTTIARGGANAEGAILSLCLPFLSFILGTLQFVFLQGQVFWTSMKALGLLVRDIIISARSWDADFQKIQ